MNVIKSWAVLAGSLFLVVSCASTSNPTSAPAPTARERSIAKRIFQLVNAERAHAGGKPFRGDRVLNQMAQTHSKFQATSSLTGGKPSHFGTQNRSQYAYLKHGIENLGEIIYVVPASDPDPAGTTMLAWKQSVEHRRHINQSWDITGIGVYRTPTQIYITMLVGVRPGGVPRSMQAHSWH